MIHEVDTSTLRDYSAFWMSPGRIWNRDFERVVSGLPSANAKAFELLDDGKPVAAGWVQEDRFESRLLGAPARRAHVLVMAPFSLASRLELVAWLGLQFVGARFSSIQTWQKEGVEIGEALDGFQLVAVDRYFVGTAETLNLPSSPPVAPEPYWTRQDTVGALSTTDREAIRDIHGTVRWRSRFHADPDCDPDYARRRADGELSRLLDQLEVPVILGLRDDRIVAYWITPIEHDLDLAARHAQGANLDEGSGIATCMFVRQHMMMLSEVSTVLHPTQKDNQRVAKLMTELGCKVLCYRYNFHRWTSL